MAKRLPKPLGLKPSREDFSSESVVCPVADCGGRMRRGALICGLCWLKLPWATQNALFAKGPAREEAVQRFQELLRQGLTPEEIRL